MLFNTFIRKILVSHELPRRTSQWSTKWGDHDRNGEENPQNGFEWSSNGSARASMVGIPKSAVHRILTDNLDMRKLRARWVPRLLTMEQKQRREDVSIKCLAIFHSNKAEFSRRFITVDEPCVHHFTPETKQQSKNELKMENRLQIRRRQFNLLARPWHQIWDARGINFIDYLWKGESINGEYSARFF